MCHFDPPRFHEVILAELEIGDLFIVQIDYFVAVHDLANTSDSDSVEYESIQIEMYIIIYNYLISYK